MTARTPQRQQLIELIGPVITDAGYDLDDLSVTAAGRRSLIRVSVDGEHGIDLDAVATISRTISEVLDDDSGSGLGFAGPYVLEVSSPGVDRPLTQPRHWRRATGRLVTVGLTSQDAQQLTGRVVSADDSTVVLDIAGTRRGLPLADLGPGRVQVEFSRPGEPEPDDSELGDEDLGDAELDDADLDDAEVTEDGEFTEDDLTDGELTRDDPDYQQTHTKEA
jgi:ribosome maturation factor RimP